VLTVIVRAALDGLLSRPHWAGSQTRKEHHMATIANLTKKDGGFSGTLILPSLEGKKITLSPVKNPTDKGPDYRVTIGSFEAGAAWTKTSKQGNAYISLKLSDPSFHGNTIYPVVVKSEKLGYRLDWNPQPRKLRPEQHEDENF
jgi:uncharacterized protein (DUF736 family)